MVGCFSYLSLLKGAIYHSPSFLPPSSPSRRVSLRERFRMDACSYHAHTSPSLASYCLSDQVQDSQPTFTFAISSFCLSLLPHLLLFLPHSSPPASSPAFSHFLQATLICLNARLLLKPLSLPLESVFYPTLTPVFQDSTSSLKKLLGSYFLRERFSNHVDKIILRTQIKHRVRVSPKTCISQAQQERTLNSI